MVKVRRKAPRPPEKDDTFLSSSFGHPLPLETQTVRTVTDRSLLLEGSGLCVSVKHRRLLYPTETCFYVKDPGTGV